MSRRVELTTTRDRILDAAANLMRREGLAQATTKEIARGAGISEPALYRHFRDQQDIFLHVLSERMPGFIAAMKDLPARVGHGDVARALEGIALSALSFYAEVGPMAGSLFSEPALLARHREAMRREKAGPHLALLRLAAYLHAEQAIGRLPATLDADTTAALLMGACFHRAFLQRFRAVPNTALDDRRFVKKAVGALLRPGRGPTRGRKRR
jgi:AcrR family transcriptional regulator